MTAKSTNLMKKKLTKTLKKVSKIERMKRARFSLLEAAKTPGHLKRINCSKISVVRCSTHYW